MNTDLMFSSNKDDWETPQEIFEKLNNEFHFTLDPCASEKNHKCDKYYTKDQDGLNIYWENEVVFCNPPYGRRTTGKWVEKCYNANKNDNCICVMLIPARTDTKWFREFIYNKSNVEVRFLKGRLKFSNKDRAPFPSMIVIFK